MGNLAVNLLTGQSLDTYHIQVLGVIYLLCYAGLLLLFSSFRLPNPGCDLLVKAAVIFILCDEGYVTYFNSLYSEPVQMLGLLIHPAFETVRQLMPVVMLENLPNLAFQWEYAGRCWLVGLGLLLLSIGIGLAAFDKKEVR